MEEKGVQVGTWRQKGGRMFEWANRLKARQLLMGCISWDYRRREDLWSLAFWEVESLEFSNLKLVYRLMEFEERYAWMGGRFDLILFFYILLHFYGALHRTFRPF